MTEVKATIWDEATGEVVGHLTANPATILANQQTGRAMWLGEELDAAEWRFEGRRPVRRPEAALAAERLEAVRAAALARLPAVLDAAAAPLIARYPAAERLGWPQKEAAARALLAGQPAAPILATEAAATRSTPDALARKVAGKADTFRAAVAVLSARRETAEAALAAATTPEEIAAALDAAGAAMGGETVSAKK